MLSKKIKGTVRNIRSLLFEALSARLSAKDRLFETLLCGLSFANSPTSRIMLLYDTICGTADVVNDPPDNPDESLLNSFKRSDNLGLVGNVTSCNLP